MERFEAGLGYKNILEEILLEAGNNLRLCYHVLDNSVKVQSLLFASCPLTSVYCV